MSKTPELLDAIEPLFRSLAAKERDPDDFYVELRQETALALLNREKQSKEITTPISIGIARNISRDMISAGLARRQRFVTFADLRPHEEHGATGEPSFQARHGSSDSPTFDALWESQCCPHHRYVVQKWRKSLRPQVQRVLRGLRRGLTQAEVAAREGVPSGTVAAWAHRSRRKLKAMLEQ